jgi:hypothetical protein
VNKIPDDIPQNIAVKLGNIHDTYKFLFIILMTAALANALSISFSHESITSNFWFNFALCIVYILFFCRFFLGDMRLLDAKYIEREHDTHNKDKGYECKHTPRDRALDFLTLFFHGIIFYVLSVFILDFLNFYLIISTLLLVNAIWLLLSHVSSNPHDVNDPVIKNSVFWAKNNLIFFFGFVILFYYSVEVTWQYTEIIFIVLTVANSLLDLWFTRATYFPQINK